MKAIPQYIKVPSEAVVGFGTDEFSVRKIDRATANNIIEREHYSKRFVISSRLHFGVFIGERLEGVLQFGVAMNPCSMQAVVWGTGQYEYLELNRMWLSPRAKRNSESRAISYAIKLIRAIEPHVAWVQSFADARCRRLGVVYQAANFLYLGEHEGKFWTAGGETFHDSLITDGQKKQSAQPRAVAAKKLLASGNLKKRIIRQFRYIFFIKPEWRSRLLFQVFPYPKPRCRTKWRSRRISNAQGLVRFQGNAPKTPHEHLQSKRRHASAAPGSQLPI